MTYKTIEQQVQELHLAGHSIRGIASILQIDKSKVQRIIKVYQDSADYPDDTDDTADDTPYDTLPDTADTGSERPFDTANSLIDTESLAYNTPFDTPKQSKKHSVSAINIREGIYTSTKRSYTLAEVKNLMAQVFLFKQEYNEFVSYAISIHSGNPLAFVKLNDYQGVTRKAKRLQQSAKHLAVQLEEDYKELLVTQVLLSIQEVVNNVLTGKDPVEISYGSYNLGGKTRALQIWVDSTESDFLQPAFYDNE